MIKIQRFASPEFRRLLSRGALTDNFIIESAVVVAADGRERGLHKEYLSTAVKFSCCLCEAEHLVGVRLQFRDGSTETVQVDSKVPVGGAVDFAFKIKF